MRANLSLNSSSPRLLGALAKDAGSCPPLLCNPDKVSLQRIWREAHLAIDFPNVVGERVDEHQSGDPIGMLCRIADGRWATLAVTNEGDLFAAEGIETRRQITIRDIVDEAVQRVTT